MTVVTAVQSVDRAARVLEHLAVHGEASIGELGRALGVHASTASRLVAALAEHHLVERTDAGPVRLGVGVLRLAAATRGRLDLAEQSREVCEELAAELGETVNVAVYRDGAAVNVHQSRGPSTIAMHSWVGEAAALHATATGKMLLAHQDEAEQERVLGLVREAFTPRTVTGVAALEAELRRAREAGWVAAVEEYEPGLVAVAVPIRGEDGAVAAAMSAAGPAYRLPAEGLDAVARRLERGASEISARMGWRTDQP